LVIKIEGILGVNFTIWKFETHSLYILIIFW
jgi:hypothetical protein